MTVSHGYYLPLEEKALPTAARKPWVATATNGSIALETNNTRLRVTSSAGDYVFRRNIVPTDKINQATRQSDRVFLQMEVWVASSSGSTGPNSWGLTIDDGTRAITLSVGGTMDWTDPNNNNNVVGSIVGTFPNGRWASVRLEKIGSQRWEAWLDGKLVGVLPYHQGTAYNQSPPIFEWGAVDPGGTSVTYVRRVEYGANVVVPHDWEVERYRDAAGPSLYNRWNPRLDAVWRAIIGMQEAVQDGIRRARSFIGAGREQVVGATGPYAQSFKGDQLPPAEDSRWEWVNGGAEASVVRGRIRISGDPASSDEFISESTPALVAEQNENQVLMARATFTLRATVQTSAVWYGPAIRIHMGGRMAIALLRRTDSSSRDFGWRLHRTQTSSVGEASLWPVNPYEPHTVELYMLGTDRVILAVDGRIVDEQVVTSFNNNAGEPQVSIGRYAASTNYCTVDIEDGAIEVHQYDRQSRPLYQQRIQEELVFAGGCESNARLDTWLRHHVGMMQMRGTTAGILLELQRLACSEDAQIISDLTPASWVLETSYPEVTPIFLDAAGNVGDVYAEFPAASPNFTPQRLADTVAFYLLPVSTEDIRYFASLRTLLVATTAASTVGTAPSLICPVESIEGFKVGQSGAIRESSNSYRDAITILAIRESADSVLGNGPEIEISRPTQSYATDDVIRVNLARS